MARLKAAAGTTDVNVGETDYPVPADGVIDVPDNAVDDLVARGGFELDPDAPAPVIGTLIMKAPDINASCSYAGVSYTAGADGNVAVPVDAVAALISHGFAVVSG